MICEETKNKMEQIASVCIRCRRCMKECIMLNRFAQNPKALFEEYLQKGPENMDRRIAYSCNECSQCTLKCPKGLNLKAVFMSLKADYAAENGGIVPVDALLPSEQGQEKECSPGYCTVLMAGSGKIADHRARYLFIKGKFPPEPILRHLKDSLGESNVEMYEEAIWDQVPETLRTYLQAADSQAIITACPSSYRTLTEAFPQRKVLFYWDLMQDLIGVPQETFLADAALHLHDGVGHSVRWVLDQLGCRWEEDPAAIAPDQADRDCRQVLGLMFGEQKTAPVFLDRKKDMHEK